MTVKFCSLFQCVYAQVIAVPASARKKPLFLRSEALFKALSRLLRLKIETSAARLPCTSPFEFSPTVLTVQNCKRPFTVHCQVLITSCLLRWAATIRGLPFCSTACSLSAPSLTLVALVVCLPCLVVLSLTLLPLRRVFSPRRSVLLQA